MKESRRITPLRTILRNCLNHIENLETNPSNCDNYDKEFQDLKQFSETLKVQKEFACTEGEKEVNRKKNRYKDILPFNVSRVILSEYAGVPGSDYINANFIKGASGSPAYIASQGPLPNTVNDFWRMVVECEVQVIVMACNAQESGKHKCENYWVEKEGEEKRFGMVQICLVKASVVCPDFLVRTMRLKYTNDKDVTEERTVCQFHYSAWPDHGVPPLVRPLLDMVRLVRDTQASETLPVLVHCSAGCGRTGTICAIDFVWGLLRAGKLTEEFSLFNLVRDMRKQRVAMVQTKEQYILVHQAVRELFKEQLQVIESHPYENIDFNGVPLIKDLEEPFYDTICVQKEENCDEKQDKSEVKEKEENEEVKLIERDKGEAPPLPRKKRPNVLFSKQEKEAENLTEKNRLSFAEKEKDKTDASFSSLLGKPRIVKLRALFEKSPTAKERSSLKDRGSQTVARSHSLGAVRKPVTVELFGPELDKCMPSTSPQIPNTSDPAKLKHSKSFSKSVPLIKRSKSLKTFSQSSIMSVPSSTLTDKKIVKSVPSKSQNTEGSSLREAKLKKPIGLISAFVEAPFSATDCGVALGEPTKNCSIRRRSLESLMGDIPPAVTWPITLMKVDQNKEKLSQKLNYCTGQKGKVADSMLRQLRCLNLESEKRISNVASGLGTRERRNSFRQAVDKSDGRNAVYHSRETLAVGNKKENIINLFNEHEKFNEGKLYGLELKKTSSSGRINLDMYDSKLQDQISSFLDNSGLVMKNFNEKQFVRENSTYMNDKSLAFNSALDCRMRITGISNEKNMNVRSHDELDLNLKPKNLFLRKLNSEILSDRDNNKFKTGEQRPRSNFDKTEKLSGNFNTDQLLCRDVKKHQKTSLRSTPSYNSENIDETDGPKSILVRAPKVENIDKVISPWPSTNCSDHQIYVKYSKVPNFVNEYKIYTESSNSDFYKADAKKKEIILHQQVLGDTSSRIKETRHKDTVLLFSQKKNPAYISPIQIPTGHDVEVSPSGSYRKISSHVNSDLISTLHPEHDKAEKKFQLPSKTLNANKNQKASFDCLPWHSHSGSSRSSGEGTSSDQLSTKSDSVRVLPNYEVDGSSKSEIRPFVNLEESKRIVKIRPKDSTKICKSVKGISTTLNNTRRPEDTVTSSVDINNYGIISNSKLSENPPKYSKDDFLLDEPTAPPRVKRHASVTIPRSNLSNAEHVPSWISGENKTVGNRNHTFQVNKTAWNDSFGVDLDAVAASMQQGESSVLKSTIWPGKKNASGSSVLNTKKKQHYF